MQVTYHFDFGSPYAYLGWQRIRHHPEAYAGAELHYVAISAGHIFHADGTRPNADYPNQRAYMWQDCQRIADSLGVPFSPPADGSPAQMPVRSLDAMRLHAYAIEHGLDEPWRREVFLAYFEHGRDINSREVLDELMERIGLPGTSALAKESQWKDALAQATKAAYEAGAPGVPFITIDAADGVESFWGQDRLEWVESRIALAA